MIPLCTVYPLLGEAPGWLLAYLLLAAGGILSSLLLALQAWEHVRFARSCLADLARHQPKGRALVLVPCKGHDLGLEENLRALLRQDYPDYELRLIVESAADPACAVIRRVMAAHPDVKSRLVVAGSAIRSGQKVHNLRFATVGLSPRIHYLAFLDSDGRPRPYWLRLAIARLYRLEMGAATGYRWFIPQRASLANALLYSMNCDLMSRLGRRSPHLVWGGSWALRRATFQRIGLRRAWHGTISDDLVAARLLRQARRYVRFEPACVVASPVDYSLAEMFTFLRRQYVVVRHYASGWWCLALATSSARMLVWLVSLLALARGLAGGQPAPWIPAAVLALFYGLGVFRSALIQQLGHIYFPDQADALRRVRRFDLCARPVAELVHWLGLVSSAWGRHVTWRGIRYRLAGDGRVAGRTAAPPPDRGPSAPPIPVPTPQPVSSLR